MFVYHGTGEVDFEATAELAAQDGPGEDAPVDEEQPAPAAGAPHLESAPGTGHVPGAPGRGSSPTGRGWCPGTEHTPDTTDAPRRSQTATVGQGASPGVPSPGWG
ncbi:hypothetical protein ACFCYB_42430, partial [Streptomyces sp. NPDC056309]